MKLSDALEQFRARSWILDCWMLTYMGVVVKSCLWFMDLKEPTTAQATFVTIITAAAGAMATIYANARQQK